MSARIFRLAGGCLVLCALAFGQSEDTLNVNERILRIRELGKRGTAVLPMLAGYLDDRNPDIRIESVKAIVRIGTEQSLDPLVHATTDKNSEVQIRATDGLVNVYVPGYVNRGGLTGSLSKGARQVKSFFVSRNDQVVGSDVSIRANVAQALSDEIDHGSSIDVRANAALAAGILRDRTAVPALRRALHGKDSQLIFESLVALQKIHDTSAGPDMSFLARDLDERIQLTALETIGALRSVSSAPDVRSAVQGARNLKVRRAALQTLAMLGQPEDRPIFQKYAAERDTELRSSALEGLGRIREPEDTPTLQKAFDEAEIDWRIHLAAAFGLVSEGQVDSGEFSPLPYLLENLRTRGHADTASAYLTELSRRENVRSALEKMLPQLDKTQKMALCGALGSTQDPAVLPMLTKLSQDADADVAVAASKAIKDVAVAASKAIKTVQARQVS